MIALRRPQVALLWCELQGTECAHAVGISGARKGSGKEVDMLAKIACPVRLGCHESPTCMDIVIERP